MAAEVYPLFIDGEEHYAVDEHFFNVEDPATGHVAFRASDAGESDVADAIRSARTAFADGRWSGLSGRERARILNRAAAMLADSVEHLAELETCQIGRPVREMRAQLQRLPEWLEYFASVSQTIEGRVPEVDGGHINYVRRVPIGVAALITPWNHPLLILMKKLSAALSAGNTVVVKPSELAPITPVMLARLLNEAGLPPGVINVVTGFGTTTGAALTRHPGLDRIDLTGGTPTGRTVAAAAGHNLVPVTVELGGKAPVLVFDDVAVEDAVAGALFASFIATGQTCIQGARILVHRDVFHQFCGRLVERTRQLRIGHPLRAETQIGPLVSSKQREHVSSAVDQARREGAAVLCGGAPPPSSDLADGYYYEPTLLSEIAQDMEVWREEIFGPVSLLVPFDSEEEAVQLANDSPYGLAAAVWTASGARAHRVASQLDVGIVWINDHHRVDPASPWGGAKDSGIGLENGIDGYLSYTRTKSVMVNTSSVATDWFGGGGEQRYS